MLVAIARRLLSTLITLFGVAVVIFVILRLLPGNAITASLGVSAGLLSHAQITQLDHFYGIGESPVSQFTSWLGATLTGNLGVSLSSQKPVAGMIAQALPVTLELGIMALAIGVLLGVFFGVVGALRPGHIGDLAGQALALVGLAVPSFVLGTALVTFMSSTFHYFPSSESYAGLFANTWLNLQQIFFPACVLGVGIAAAIMRTTRAAVLEINTQNFVRTARGKGVSERAVVWRHLLLNALVPIVTMSGIQLGYLLGGTVIIEEIFVLPGLGRMLVTAINNRDFPVVQSVTMLFAAGFVVINMLTDVFSAVIDPRSKDR
ncbi:MAG: ABC transporter permease [Actinomycetota bacterium]|nr:ABC transporter permease [Actinomycetota bacterium]